MSIARKLRLLFWKYLLLCKHHWILKSCEILLPIIIVCVLCEVNKLQNVSNHNDQQGESFGVHSPLVQRNSDGQVKSPIIYEPETVDELMRETNSIYYVLVFAPNTTFTRDIIERTRKLFTNLKRYPVFVMKELNTDEEVIDAVAARKDIILDRYQDSRVMGVYFIGVHENETVPNKFSYKIHLINAPDTSEMFTSSFDPPHVGGYDKYVSSGFAGLQVALDMAFIQYNKLNESEYKQVMMQRIPYPNSDKSHDDQFRSFLLAAVCPIIILATFFQAFPLINAIISEKESGVKELMKMVGLGESLVWISWFLNSLVMSIFMITSITILIRFDFLGENTALLKFVDATVLWSLLVLFVIANITFCFLFCAIFHKTTYAGFLYLLTVLVVKFAATATNKNMKLVACLLPQGALTQGFERITVYELLRLPLNWSSLSDAEINVYTQSLRFTFIMLLLQTLLYSFLTYYISAVNPGPFGARKSPFFIFEFLGSCFKDSSDDLMRLEETSDNKYIEKGPAHGKTSVRIKDLRKNFRGVNAVKGINLNIYENEITALLGHNGAGKTTTIAMLTGLTSPSGGSIVYKNNLEVFERMDDFRSKLGLCLQENRVFPYLSVLNHLLFFGMLKGISQKEATEEAMQYLTLMEMLDKKNSMVVSLSGGMKRKLCLAVALMGKAEILILDEPTSGLDVQSRRKIWDLLLVLRGSRTIILTTHYMEEADVLGDRIAIMQHGMIECHGTPLFLKKVYGAGYEITITKENEDCDDRMLTKEITKNVPGAELKESRVNEVVYQLPLTETATFPAMFEALKRERDNLGIKSIGVNCTTMEDVFLRAGGLVNKNTNNTTNGSSIANEDYSQFDTADKRKTGLHLIIQQLEALMRKKFLYVIRRYDDFLMRVLFPMLVAFFILWLPSSTRFQNTPLELSLSAYPHSYVMVQNDNQPASNLNENFREYVRGSGDELILNEKSYIEQGLLEYSHDHLLQYRTDIIGAAQFNSSNKLVLFNSFATHSFGVILNTYTNAFLRARSNNNFSVVTINHPVTSDSEKKNNIQDSRDSPLIFWWFVLAWFTVDLTDYFCGPIRTERLEGFKHVQFISKVTPFVYWLSNVLFDSFYFLLIMAVRLILLSPYGYQGFLSFENLGILFIIFVAFIPGGLLFSYAMCFLATTKQASYTITSLFNFTGIVLVLLVYASMEMPKFADGFGWMILINIAKYLVFLSPPLNLFLIFLKFMFLLAGKLQGDTSKMHYLVFMDKENPFGFLEEILFLIADIFAYAAILALIEMGYVSKAVNYVTSSLSRNGSPIDNEPLDENVKEERYRLLKMIETTDFSQNQAILLVQKLKKNYVSFLSLIGFKPALTAVHDVTFAVEAAQCFGLLGVNGAGKSTTFKILTGEIQPTEGNASIHKYRLKENRSKYLAAVGYCAQTNCFVEELTGREMLTLIASLRGVYANNVNEIVNKWLSILGLDMYQNRQCGSYSGGNKRKLCTAMSLVGDPNVVFLDEPTSGVDPISRRKLYDVMGQSKAAGQAVVLTSHSMEECEQLCDRLTIMAKGQMKCIGSPQELKHQFAQGFSVQIKLHDDQFSENLVAAVKQSMVANFKPQFCNLKDEHKGLLYYQITNTDVEWLESFSKMEQIKSSHNIIDDYVITDTSLEQVFLSFAKE